MNGSVGAPQQHRIVAAGAYLLFIVSGLVLLYLEPYSKDDYVRFHARQSIGFTIAWVAINIIFDVFVAVLPHPLNRLLAGVSSLVNLALAVFWIFLMYEAYMGERYRIPQLADIIDGFGNPA